MRAVVVRDGRLDVEERATPTPAPDEVLVRVHGAGVNRADLLQRAGHYPAPPGVPVDIPGLEFAGVVEARGADVVGVAVGDRVMGLAGGGAQATHLAIRADQCTRVPDGADLVTMGGVPEVFVTAHDGMVVQGRLRAGEWVLVHAVGSGVGTAALQLGVALGARVVGTARTPDKLDRARALGLHAGIVPARVEDPHGGRAHDLDVDALAAAIRDATGGHGADVVVELVGGAYVDADLAAAAPRARIVLIGALAGARASLPILTVMGLRLTIVGTVLRSRSLDEKADAVAAFARDVVPLLADGTLEPVLDTVVPIERATDAYDLVASDTTFGKVVLDCR
ncbi:MAG TPA: zinc-binding dehydrogenase [Acidimicrobiia bacterium]|nr:zinc-binding dehydrogenase [Acidimicrobiia bacterium]